MFGAVALLLVVFPPHFQAAPGWYVGSSSSRACPGVSASRCVDAWGWASTIPFRDCRDCVAPHKTLAHLPSGGVVIQLSNARERPARISPGKWPVRIHGSDVHAGGEGVSRRQGAFQRAVRTTDGVEHLLYVWFGRAHPTRHQLASANAELRTVR
jgi:hypothetical protein